jgi:hypothetical protein
MKSKNVGIDIIETERKRKRQILRTYMRREQVQDLLEVGRQGTKIRGDKNRQPVKAKRNEERERYI